MKSYQNDRYRSYMLRLWQTQDGNRQIWHYSLECPNTGDRQGFATLEDLLDFLQLQTESSPGHPVEVDLSVHESA